MDRRHFKTPLLIGGATTSKLHTAIKIAPKYSAGTVHVLDASRAVGVVSTLLNADKKPDFLASIAAEYARLRTEQESRQSDRIIVPIETARADRLKLEFNDPERPPFIGVRVLEDVPLSQIEPFIDWTPLFQTWEMRGRFPAIIEEPRARELYDDARKLLREIIEKRLLTARAVYGFWPANSAGDDIELYRDGQKFAMLRTLRQQQEKTGGQPHFALSDYLAPKGTPDYVGAFAVTAGIGIEKLVARFDRDHDDYNSIMTKALADRLAEALAEMLHQQVRTSWYAGEEKLTTEQLIGEQYRGIRPAPGYPACPDHTEKFTLFELLEAERIGMKLTESGAMTPAASVSGYYFAHPEARYFALGKIGRDQVSDYARRKGIPFAEAERWLSPNLAYEPEGFAVRELAPASR